MTAREPTFVQAEIEEAKRQPLPIFTFYGAPKSETDEVSLKKPGKRVVFDEILQTTTRNLAALVESWRYPIRHSTGTDDQKFVDAQMRVGFPLLAQRDPKNESICWQLNIRRSVPGRIEFDALAYNGELGKEVIVLWLTHVGHLEFIQRTNATVRAILNSYFDDSFVEYSLGLVAKKILGILKGGNISLEDSETILHRIDTLHSDLSEKLDDIKTGQRNIYERLGAEAQSTVNSILDEVRAQSVSQGDMQRTLDAIRRALKYALNEGSLTNDPTIKQSLLEISKAVNSNASFEQQFELSIPIIPFLLQYKVLLGAGVELDAVWKELQERVQKKSK